MWKISKTPHHKGNFGDQYLGKDFTERETSEVSGFGELPDDLRGMVPTQLPDGTFIPGFEMDSYALFGGAHRQFVEPIPGEYGNQFGFTAINYLPRANFPSFRSQRFYSHGMALLPPVGPSGDFTDLFVDLASLPPSSPQTVSSGEKLVPTGFAAVLTGISQWIGDATAFQKTDGSPDDITWRVVLGGSAAFDLGNIQCLLSTLTEEQELFVIAVEDTPIQFSVRNSIDPSDPLARDIAVKGQITGHWFPMDELDDAFRNR